MEIGKRSAVHPPAPRRVETARPAPQNAAPQTNPYAPKQSRSKLKPLLFGLIGLVAVAAIGLSIWKLTSGNTELIGIDSSKYQAVFLSNGQVYFGKLADSSDFQIKITNIYYLQQQQDVQQQGEKKDDNSNNQVSLAKLGNELHGPQDTMYIAKDQVLFWENLKDDSKVVQAIKSTNPR